MRKERKESAINHEYEQGVYLADVLEFLGVGVVAGQQEGAVHSRTLALAIVRLSLHTRTDGRGEVSPESQSNGGSSRGWCKRSAVGVRTNPDRDEID